MNTLKFRNPNPADIKLLAEMNFDLIQDEGHRNKMNVDQLGKRMSDWLLNEYKAVIFHDQNEEIGYALYKKDPDWIYLR